MSVRLPIALNPDPVVPQRDTLMDLDAVAGRLSMGLGAHGPVTIEACRRTFVSYRIGRRLRVAYRIQIRGRDHHVAASTFRSRSRSERAYRKAMEGANWSDSLRPALHDAELNTVFWTFPNDRRISSLSAIAQATPGLTRALYGRWTKSRLIDYYPEVSAVVRCLDDSNEIVAYAKVHAGDEGESTHRALLAFVRAAHGSNLRLARPFAYSRQHHTLVVEPIVGRAIGSLDGQEVVDGLHAYGAALATLHSLPLAELPLPSRSPLDRMYRKAEGIGIVRPEVETSSRELLETLGSRWAEALGAPVFVHGDTNLNNAILQDGRVAFIDFDRASIGSAGSDIGNTLGLLKYLRSVGVLSPTAESQRAAAFVRGYATVRALPDPSSLRVHLSLALAERAFRAVNRVRARALLHLPALLTEARALLSTNGELS